MLDVKIVGKHANLIHSGDYEIYGAEWLRMAVRCLMSEAYDLGRLNKFPYNHELAKNSGDGWQELHEEFNRRIDDMLDIGIQHVKETNIKGTKSKLTVADERAWDPGRPLTIDEAHYYYK